MKKVILNSGGMDSFLLAVREDWRDAIHVFVDIQQPYKLKELISAQRIAQYCNTTLTEMRGAEIAFFEHPSGIIPFRNAEMILCAAQYGNEIGLGVIADEVNSDKSPEFFRAMERVLNISHAAQYWTEGRLHKIVTPLAGMTKAEHIKAYLSRGGKMDALLATVSCYDGDQHHCGECASCFKRWVALTVATGDPFVQFYINKPWEAYSKEALLKRFPTFSEKRIEETRFAYNRVGVEL